MKIILDDTFTKQQLYPFTAIRNAADIRIGILTIREKWEKILGYAISTNDAEKASSNEKDAPAFISSDIVPTKKWLDKMLANGVGENMLQDETEVRVLQHAFDIVKNNDWALRKDFELITTGRQSQPISSTNKVIAPENIFIEEGAKVEYSILNASAGPIYIGKNAEVMEGCMIRGSFAMCEGAILKMGAKVYGATTLGPNCVGAGEIKNTVMFANSNKGHDGYLGDSVLGEWCNLGAGTTNSNVKNTAAHVRMWDNAKDDYIDVGYKAGLLMGDYSRAAINTSFNTGTVVGICCNIFESGFPSKKVDDFTWGNKKYELEKALEHIDNWKKLKGQYLTQQEKDILITLYNK
ncbi:MAG TPA: putative sugar nucleotidyl transferase [Ferruginibacter sp.]|nr:putative sugar nucleotidyl transferase [Ferruginibacter sp.]